MGDVWSTIMYNKNEMFLKKYTETKMFVLLPCRSEVFPHDLVVKS